MKPAPDPDLIRTAKAGDEVAFEELLRPLIDPAYRFACVMLSDPAAAEDVVQEAAVKAWRKLDQLRDGYDPQPWFLGIVANQCRSLRRAVQRLNPRDRAVITLHYFLDLPLEDVAAATRQSVAAVRSQVYRALHKMRPSLEIPEVLR